VAIRDITPLVRKLHGLIQAGETGKARTLMPRERVYPAGAETAWRLGMN
jgi:hypothetical protein